MGLGCADCKGLGIKNCNQGREDDKEEEEGTGIGNRVKEDEFKVDSNRISGHKVNTGAV
tara:strand:- start:12 stop:188 length:177 start_codon:yes stop_codon:yes gene_type:complete